MCGLAGTHGKTTTTAITAAAFEQAGLPGSHLVGAPLQGSHGNARYTAGSPFVLEADEYRGAFLEYAYRFAQLVITKIDFDYRTATRRRTRWRRRSGCCRLISRRRVFACGDSAGVQAVAQKYDRITTCGFDKSNAAWVRLAVAAQAGAGSR